MRHDGAPSPSPARLEADRDGPGAGAKEATAAQRRLSPKDILGVAGPGIITGGADDDPAGVTTHSVVGAQAGFSQNWLLLLSTPMMIVTQQMSARIGNILKTDRVDAIRVHYGRNLALSAVSLTVLANVLTVGADLLMMAAVAELVTGVRFSYFIVPFAAFMAYITIFWNYKVFSRFLLWVVVVFLCYIFAAILAHPNWRTVLTDTFIPQIQLSSQYLVSAFIIAATGAVLFTHHAQIQTAADAAKALQPFAGAYTKYLFAAGILGSGLVAIPVLAASTAYAVGGLLGWRPARSGSGPC